MIEYTLTVTGMHDGTKNVHNNSNIIVSSAIPLGEYPQKPQTKMEHFVILTVLLCWNLSGTTSGELITNLCSLCYKSTVDLHL